MIDPDRIAHKFEAPTDQYRYSINLLKIKNTRQAKDNKISGNDVIEYFWEYQNADSSR